MFKSCNSAKLLRCKGKKVVQGYATGGRGRVCAGRPDEGHVYKSGCGSRGSGGVPVEVMSGGGSNAWVSTRHD